MTPPPRIAIVLLPLVFPIGCVVQSTPTEADPDYEGTLLDVVNGCEKCDHADSIELEGTATYEVPLSEDAPAALVEASRTFVDDVELEVEGATVTLDYDLPLALAGIDQEVELSGPVGQGLPLILTGPSGEASCVLALAPREAGSAPALTIECDELLSGVRVDPTAVAAHLADSGLSEAAILAHVEVSKIFFGDPIGILSGTLQFNPED